MAKKKNRYKTDLTKKKKWRSFAGAVLALTFLIVIIPLLSAAFAHCYYALLESSWPQVEEIEITGINHIDRKEVLNVLAIPRGANLLTVRAPQLARRLEAIAWLRSAVVRFDLFGRIVVDVSEREPLAVIHAADFFLIDTQGKLFLKVHPAKYQDLLLVTGFSDSELRGASYLQTKPLEALQGLLAALQKVQDWLPSHRISECHWGGAEGFTLYTTHGGIPIHLGRDEFDGKLARLNRIFGVLMDHQCLNSVTRIDVDYSNRAYIEGHFPAPKGI